MKFSKSFLFIFIIFVSCSSKQDLIDPNQMHPAYKLLNIYSRKIEPKTGLKLYAYAYNSAFATDYQIQKGIGNFSSDYYLFKKKTDIVSLKDARNLIVNVSENLIRYINENLEIKPLLDIHPFSSERISLSIDFVDDNKIHLGQGVAYVYIYSGKIIYKGFDIIEYRNKYPSLGKRYLIHEESYEEALDVVKREGNLTYLD